MVGRSGGRSRPSGSSYFVTQIRQAEFFEWNMVGIRGCSVVGWFKVICVMDASMLRFSDVCTSPVAETM